MIEDPRTVDALVGRTVGGRYQLRHRIGEGGMGVVYAAHHTGLDKQVAVKFLLDKYAHDDEVVERFHREARTASAIGHENIVDVTDIGRDADGRPYIVMEYLRGADLAVVLRQSGPMPPARAVYIVLQILRGLEAAHAKGIVHRDMKPENVFVTPRGERGDFVKIMDFGISKVIAAHDSKVRLTRTGVVVGTPVYMAPEQAIADETMDHRVDLYAVGVMLYELLSGQPPFTAKNYLALATQHLHAEVPPLGSRGVHVPVALEAACRRALAKDPRERFGSAAEMAAALPSIESLASATDGVATLSDGAPAMIASQRAASAAPTPTSHAPRARSKAPWVLLGGAAIVAALLVAFTASSATDPAPTPAPAPENLATAEQAGDDRAEPGPAVQPLTGALELDSQPQGARVWLGERDVGLTPVILEEVEIGTHPVRFELDGYRVLEQRKRVRAGVRESLVVALAPAEATSAPGREATGSTTDTPKNAPRDRARDRQDPRRPARATDDIPRPDLPIVDVSPAQTPPPPRSGKGEVSPATRTESGPRTPRTGSKPNPYLD